MDPAEQQLLATTAGLLDMGCAIDRLSRPLTVLASAGLLTPLVAPVPIAGWLALLAAGLAGLAATYAAVRVAFDAALFRALATEAGDCALLDGALMQLGLLKPHKTGRPLGERVAGAQRLLRRQALLLAVQTAALAAAGIAGLSVS